MAQYVIHTVAIFQAGASIEYCSCSLWNRGSVFVCCQYVFWTMRERDGEGKMGKGWGRGKREGRWERGVREGEGGRERGGREEGREGERGKGGREGSGVEGEERRAGTCT